MAKDKRDGIYVEKPKVGVYDVLVILSFAAMVIAVALMFLENSALKG